MFYTREAALCLESAAWSYVYATTYALHSLLGADMSSIATSSLVYNLDVRAGAGAGLRSVISRTRARHTAQPRARNHGPPETRYRHYHTPYPPHWDGEIYFVLPSFHPQCGIVPGYYNQWLVHTVPRHILYFWQQYHGRVKMVAGWLLFKQPRARTNVRQSAARVFIEIYWALDFKYFCTIYHLSLGWYFYQRAQLDYARFLVAQARSELI